MEISKELLSAVMSSDLYLIDAGYEGYFMGNPNMHELAYRCKKKAKEMGYTLESRITKSGMGACKVKTNRELVEKYGSEEPYAIFGAFEWVLAHRNNK